MRGEYAPGATIIARLMPPWIKAVGKRVLRRSTGEREIRAAYQRHYGKILNLNDAQTFSEKVFRRMIALERGADSTFTRLADKYSARDYVRQRVGSEYLIDLLWHGTDPRQIPFDSLPQPYVIKTNHGSGGHIFVRGHVDRAAIIAQMRLKLRDNYYWRAREFQYFNIEPRVLVEAIIDDGIAGGPLDYRCWCFHGQVRLIQVDNHDHTAIAFYDRSWRELELRHRRNPGRMQAIPQPENLVELIHVAETLARGIEFVRVDLYNARGRIYFGELTFTPRAGIYTFEPQEWDRTIGGWW